MHPDDLAILCILPALLCLVVPLFWASVYLGIGALRRFRDARLVTLRLGLNEMWVSRVAVENYMAVLLLAQQAIEATRRKPLDELQALTFSPRTSESNTGVEPGLDEATETLGALMTGFKMNGNGHGEED